MARRVHRFRLQVGVARRQPGAVALPGQPGNGVGAVAVGGIEMASHVRRQPVAALQSGGVVAIAGGAGERVVRVCDTLPAGSPPATTARFTACTAITR